jgi:hypothetical protein
MDDEAAARPGETDCDEVPEKAQVAVAREQAEGQLEQKMEGESDTDGAQYREGHDIEIDQTEGQQDTRLQEPCLRSGQATIASDVWVEDGMLGRRDVRVHNTYSGLISH